MAPTDVARFEVGRHFLPFAHKLKFDLSTGITLSFGDLVHARLQSVAHLTPAQLEREFGGRVGWDAQANIQGTGETCVDSFEGRGAERMPIQSPLPVPRVARAVSFTHILRIEPLF